MAGAPIEAILMLCDSAQSVAGKLYILGGGWTQLNNRTPPAMGLAIKLEISEDLAGERLPLLARLVTLSGEPVISGGNRVEFAADLEFARRPGSPLETPVGSVLALNAQFGGTLTFEPGGYAWELLSGEEILARSVFRVV